MDNFPILKDIITQVQKEPAIYRSFISIMVLSIIEALRSLRSEMQARYYRASKSRMIKRKDLSLIPSVSSFDELIAELERRGFTVKRNKYVYIKAPGQQRSVSLWKLGEDYTEESLNSRILWRMVVGDYALNAMNNDPDIYKQLAVINQDGITSIGDLEGRISRLTADYKALQAQLSRKLLEQEDAGEMTSEILVLKNSLVEKKKKIAMYTAPRHVQRFITDLTEMPCGNNPNKKLSAKTVKLHLSLVSTIFDYAIKMQMIKDNPCKNVTLPSPEKKERKIYTVEEIQQILTLFNAEPVENLKYVVFFTMALYTGLRRGELLGLEWKDFDWNRNIFTVSRNSLWTKERGMYTDTLKTASSNRCLKIQPELIELLTKYRKWQDEHKAAVGDKWQENDRLFTTWEGLPMHVTSPADFLKEFCKRNGIRYCSPHSWRHLHATLMIESGVDVKTVQACLGHSAATTTLSCYLHTFQPAQAAAMDAVGVAIRNFTNPAKPQQDTTGGL